MLEYATGLIRVLEKRILSQNDFERMLGAQSAEEAFKVLNDTDYADNLLNLKSEEFEKALMRDSKDLRKLFKKIIESKELLDFLFLKQEYFKLKLYLKSKYNKNLAKQKKPNLKIPKIKQKTPENIDRVCDLGLYKARKKIARKLRDKFLQEICKKDLDLNFDLDLIKQQARDNPCGTAVVLNYYFKKLDAARKIRTIMNAKLNRCEYTNNANDAN